METRINCRNTARKEVVQTVQLEQLIIERNAKKKYVLLNVLKCGKNYCDSKIPIVEYIPILNEKGKLIVFI